MKLSRRLEKLVEMASKTYCIADIGTDHGYVAAQLLLLGKAEIVIATDINRLPLNKARETAKSLGLEERMDFRLGQGLSVLKPGEAQGGIIAGMGGALIIEILDKSPLVVQELDYILLQPAQNPEVLRQKLYDKHYRIIAEELVQEEDGRFYEYFKVAYDKGILGFSHEPMDFVLSPVLLNNRHPLLPSYILAALKEMEEIRQKLDLQYESSRNKEQELSKKKDYYLEALKWL